jgi:hypothetical protein
MSNDDKGERTKGGSIVYKHAAREGDHGAPVEVDEHWMQAIDDHVARHVARADFVFHEIVSDKVHLDVHVVPPGDRNPFWLLYTTGMSARPMTVPAEVEVGPYAELMVLLPPSWKCDHASWKDERWYWPVRWLKTLARLPHDYDTWLGFGHTVPNGDPPKPFDKSTKLGCMLVMPSVTLPPEIHEIPVGDVSIDLFALWPIHVDEMQYKLDRGADALIDAFEAANVTDLIDPGRPSAVAKARRKKFGIF